jgi:membrane-associated phospholipid phosphatase
VARVSAVTQAYLALGLLVLAVGAAAWSLPVSLKLDPFGSGRSFGNSILIFGFLFLSAALLRRRGFHRFANGFEGISLLAGISMASALLSLLFATTARPYVDAQLIQWDYALFGISFIELTRWVQNPTTIQFLSYAYSWIDWQPFLLIVIFSVLAARERIARFAAAWGLCLLATMLIFPFYPAVGGYLHYNISAWEAPHVLVPVAWSHLTVLEPLRSGAITFIGPEHLAGIVTFPSFHASAAVLLAWGFWSVPVLKWVCATANAAMFVSSIFIGGHYLVDLLAGAVLALLTIAVVLLSERNISALHVGRSMPA